MKMMKLAFAAILATTVLTSTSAMAYTSQHRCDVVLYNGVTKKGTKRLVLCVASKGILYNFGPLRGAPELDVVIPTAKVSYYGDNRFPSIELKNGKYSYEVSNDAIYVSHNGKSLTTVEMATPEETELGQNLAEYGIHSE